MWRSPITSWQIEGEKVEIVTNFIFLGSKITLDGDCSHKIKRNLLFERKAMTNWDNMLKSRDIVLPTKVHLVKATVFPGVTYGCESWTIKKAEHPRINAFKLWCWRRHLGDPWTARSNQSILKEINPKYSLEGLMLKVQYFGHLMQRTDSRKRPWCWERLKAGGEGEDRDEMVGWHHVLVRHEFEQAPGFGDGQAVLACCSPWGHKESDRTERLKWTELMFNI